MCDQHPLTAQDRELETHLRRLTPSPPRLDRDTFMFEAGRHTARRQLRRWQGTSAALFAGAVLLGTLNLPQPATTASQARVPSPADPSPLAPSPPPPAPAQVTTHPPPPAIPEGIREYLHWRSRLLAEGADVLPNPPSCAALPEPPESWARWAPNAATDPAFRLLLLPPRSKLNRL